MKKAVALGMTIILSIIIIGCSAQNTTASTPVSSSLSVSSVAQSESTPESVVETQQDTLPSSSQIESRPMGIDAPAESDVVVSNPFFDDEPVAVLSEDALEIKNLLSQYAWSSDVPPPSCIKDCILVISDEIIQYHTECGTLTNKSKGYSSIELDAVDREALNLLLQKYIPLGIPS